MDSTLSDCEDDASQNRSTEEHMRSKLVSSIALVGTLGLGVGIGQVAGAANANRNKRHKPTVTASASAKAQSAQRANEREGRDRSEGRLKEIQFKKIVNLSHVIDENIALWPGDPAPEFTNLANIDPDGYYLRSFSMGEHSSTHMNSGNSFFAGGTSIDSYTADQLVRKAVVIDIRAKAAANRDYQLTKQDVEAWESTNGRIPKDSVVILFTGWQDKWSDQAAFIPEEEDGLHFPGFAGATTDWLLDKRQIAGVGTDTHGVDPGQDINYLTNTAVLQEKGIVLECLTNLDKLKPTGNTIVMGALALKDGSGSPLTVLGFTN
jgi:kynurenine formamidase